MIFEYKKTLFSLKFLTFYWVVILYIREVEFHFLPLLWGSTKQFEREGAYKLVVSNVEGMSLNMGVLLMWGWTIRLRYISEYDVIA